MKIIVSLLIVIVGAIATLGYFQQQRIGDLSAKNASLLRQNESLRADKDAKQPTPDEKTPVATTSYTSEKGVKVTVTAPATNAVISSPLNVSGEVPGSWSFEASFGVRLIDAQGTLLDESPANLQGDWMTDNPVPFTSTMEFGTPVTKTGTLVLLNANPSGLPENEDTVVIPVRFTQ